MKKSVILSILVIYIIAVFVVGFIGQKLKVYDPTVYVDEIVCESEGFEENTEELKAKGYIGRINVDEFTNGMKIQIKCRVNPDNATYPKLIYSIPSNTKICTMEIIDGIAVLTFTDSGFVVVTVTSSDTRKKSVKIEVNVTDLGGIL